MFFRSFPRLRHIAAMGGFLILSTTHVIAQLSSDKKAVVTSTTERIHIDGKLNEPEWARAVPLDDIRQREPNQGQPATERTEVRLLADKDHLYIGVICYDSEPDKIVATQMGRDADITVDDRVELLLDTFHDRRNAFYFSTNPAGALTDGLVVENGELNLDWNGIWLVKTHRSPQGWSAEFALPFKSLSFNPGQDVWGFNFARSIVRKVEDDRWASPRFDIDFFQVSEAGEISGFAQAEQGKGLDIRPYALGRWTRDERGEQRWQGTAGGEIFYNITSGLRLTTTINTDFAETEVDDRQINLDRFQLFFPEKRAFFLENVGVFNLAQTAPFLDPSFIPFFSRRIGLLEGREVPIQAGTRLTGKVGRFDVGALVVRTRETQFDGETKPAKTFAVARIKRNFFKQSYIGGWYTEGNPASAETNRMLGADTRLSTANFLGSERNLTVDAHYFKDIRGKGTGDNSAYGAGVAFPNDRFYGIAEWKRIERNFAPALGFVSRNATDTARFGFEFNPRLKKNFLNIRQMDHWIYFSNFRRNDLARTETRNFFIRPVGWNFNSGDEFSVTIQPQFDRLFLPFEIAPGVTLPKGDYSFTRTRLTFESAPSRPWQAALSFERGAYWSGHANEFNADVIYKFAPRLQLSLGTRQTFARLPQGNFVARIYTTQINYAFSPFLSVANFIQYDNDSRNMGWQSRLRWILRPGNDLFLVFNQGWLQNERGGFNFRATGSRVTGKLQYTLRF